MRRRRYKTLSNRAIRIPNEWIPVSVKPGGIFFFLFVCGVLLANIMGNAVGRDLGVMSGYFMDKYTYADIQGRELFSYLFYERFFEVFWLLALGIGIYGMFVFNVYIGYLGFSFGFLSVVSIINYGAKGALLMIGFLFPQYLFYIPAILVLYYGVAAWKRKKRDVQENVCRAHGKLYFLFLLVAVCMVYLFGILLESYVNPFFLQKIIKNI